MPVGMIYRGGGGGRRRAPEGEAGDEGSEDARADAELVDRPERAADRRRGDLRRGVAGGDAESGVTGGGNVNESRCVGLSRLAWRGARRASLMYTGTTPEAIPMPIPQMKRPERFRERRSDEDCAQRQDVRWDQPLWAVLGAPASMAADPVAVTQRSVPTIRGRPERMNVPRRPAARVLFIHLDRQPSFMIEPSS